MIYIGRSSTSHIGSAEVSTDQAEAEEFQGGQEKEPEDHAAHQADQPAQKAQSGEDLRRPPRPGPAVYATCRKIPPASNLNICLMEYRLSPLKRVCT